MSERNFSRRRRGGQRFRPTGGLHPHQTPRLDRAATDARADAVKDKSGAEPVFARHRHEPEIERAENLAAGLPPGAAALSAETRPDEDENRDEGGEMPGGFPSHNENNERTFTPVPVSERPA